VSLAAGGGLEMVMVEIGRAGSTYIEGPGDGENDDADVGSGIKHSQLFRSVRVGFKCGRHRSIVVRNYVD
jgi:hypothetical protein